MMANLLLSVCSCHLLKREIFPHIMNPIIHLFITQYQIGLAYFSLLKDSELCKVTKSCAYQFQPALFISTPLALIEERQTEEPKFVGLSHNVR